MTEKRARILWWWLGTACSLLAIAVLFPSWRNHLRHRILDQREPLGYHPIWSPPSPLRENSSVEVDLPRTILTCFGVVALSFPLGLVIAKLPARWLRRLALVAILTTVASVLALWLLPPLKTRWEQKAAARRVEQLMRQDEAVCDADRWWESYPLVSEQLMRQDEAVCEATDAVEKTLPGVPLYLRPDLVQARVAAAAATHKVDEALVWRELNRRRQERGFTPLAPPQPK